MSTEEGYSYVPNNNVAEDDDDFIKVKEKEDGELIEFPKEDDGTVLLRTIQTQYATAIGLKYKGPSGAWRAIKEGDDAKLVPPKSGWGNTIYFLTFSGASREDDTRKRKVVATNDSVINAKQMRSETLLRDLAVVGIHYEADQNDLKQYFENKYGGVAQLLIKSDKSTGKSMGYGFIRFDNEESARKALECEDDEFMGRRLSVKPKTQKPMKMYVNSLPEGTTREDLVEYFSKFGEIIDSFVPSPFRNYGFFTFASGDDGRECLKQEHEFKGQKINVKIRNEVGSGAKGGPSSGPSGPPQFGNPGFGNSVGFGGVGLGGGLGGGAGLGGGRGGRGSFAGSFSGGAAGGAPQNPQMAAQLKNMLFQFLSEGV